MKLGLLLGFWGEAGPPPRLLETVREAETLGYESVWTSEAFGSDALTPLAWVGAHTERMRLGTSIMQMAARAPAATAMAAVSLDHLPGRRLVLGLRRAGPPAPPAAGAAPELRGDRPPRPPAAGAGRIPGPPPVTPLAGGLRTGPPL